MMRDFRCATSAKIMEGFHELQAKMARAQREGLMGRVNEMLDAQPEGTFVAVSPPETNVFDDRAVTVHTLRPLMAGMPVPEGWTAYGRRPKPITDIKWITKDW